MRILIIFHGRLPGGPYPMAGIALRAWTNGQGLVANGLEVEYASRRRDLLGPPVPGLPAVHGFEGRAELQALVRSLAPDVILAEGTGELVSLRDCDVPIALDLFAPRVIEAQWEGLDVSQEVLALLDALSRADYFVITTPRQRYFYLGLMALAGVDCREDRFATVPLSVPDILPARSRAPEPIFVAGGIAWPWQDPRWTLERVAAQLREAGRGSLRLLRGAYPLAGSGQEAPPLPVTAEPPVSVEGLLDFPGLLELYSTAWCAVDLMAPNLERELALSFRQLDALRCGLPLLIGAHAPLAGQVAAYQAGWVVEHGDERALHAAVAEILGQPERVDERSRNAQRLALEHFATSKTIQPLVELVRTPTRRVGRETLTGALARRATEARAQEQAFADCERELAILHIDLTKKEVEVGALGQQVRGLTDTVGRLSVSLEAALRAHEIDVSERAGIVLEGQVDLATSQRALAASRREAAKKDRELQKALTQREQLEADLARLSEEQGRVSRRADSAVRESAELRGRMQSLETRNAALELELSSLQAEREKKQRELEQLIGARDRLVQEIEALAGKLEAAEDARRESEAGRVREAGALRETQARIRLLQDQSGQLELALEEAKNGGETLRTALESESAKLREALESEARARAALEAEQALGVLGAARRLGSGAARAVAGWRARP